HEMSLKEQLAQDLKEAIRSRNEARKTAIRMVTWAVKNAEVAQGKPLDDAEVVSIIAKEAKRRQESIEGFRKGQRADLVEKEEAELAVLEAYLPPPVSREEIEAAARQVIAEVGASGPADRGKVIPKVIAHFAGQADGRTINEIVTELLSR
ncbi:MAG TPA: GatB/YqeY domain-containing protein, partial [Dehalococcoidia bacterium]|nr:GatB/YqeY domain-containing protein [Dehalococcoidia bacterium]